MPDNNENKDNAQAGENSKSPGKVSKRVSTTTIILSIIAAITLVGFIGSFMSRSNQARTAPLQNYVNYPTVTSRIASSRDGKSHVIDVDLVVEYADGVSETISHDAMYKKMTETVAGLDYDALRQPDSVEYIEKTVLDGLSDTAGNDKVANVYVGNIAIDFPGYVDSASGSGNTGASFNQKAKGLFKKMQ